MRGYLAALLLFFAFAGAPAQAAEALIQKISIGELATYLQNQGFRVVMKHIGNEDVLAFGSGIDGFESILIRGFLPDKSDPSRYESLEFGAVSEVPEGLISDAALEKIDRKYELVSVDRADATYLQVTGGMVLAGGVTYSNIDENLVNFGAHLVLIGKDIDALRAGV